MTISKGKLKKASKGFQVTLPSKKGSADHQIPMNAACFRPEDASDGLEVDVERDAKNRIVKVTIPGKPEAIPVSANQSGGPGSSARGGKFSAGSHGRGYGRPQRRSSSQQSALQKLPKAAPKVLGSSFHNPYTFLPFPSKSATRLAVTPLTVDELAGESDRYTGVIELAITTQSPLLTCHPEPVKEQNGHKTYEALRIGPDVIVPATGVRGSLRTLMTILTGGTLGYLNEEAFLVQGRDLNLGPAGPNSPPGTPDKPFLAEVVRPGSSQRSGIVQLGETKLVSAEDLKRLWDIQSSRMLKPKTLWAAIGSDGRPTAVSETRSASTPWKLKLSGQPVNQKKGKREGAFLASNQTLEIPSDLWADFSGRNTHGDVKELRKGDLVWLEPASPNLQRIQKPEDVRSIQWARWGRKGESLKEHIRTRFKHILPDYLQTDGLVDEVTNLFGQVSPKRGTKVRELAARIRPENLVFFDCAQKVDRVALAPLAPPHPGCIAFYRDNKNPDDIGQQDSLRGYKVYRTTKEQGTQAPWKFEVQGVYGEKGELSSPQQKVNKTCDLLRSGLTGKLRIAFRALSKRELALLLQACAVPWRLGGGKPLGLGLCQVQVTNLIDEYGQALEVPGWTNERQSDGQLSILGWQEECQNIQGRVQMWTASQQPVDKLRYPRAVMDNDSRKARGGHSWFQRHALPRMTTSKDSTVREKGLQPLHIDDPLKTKAVNAGQTLDQQNPMVAGQLLPPFDPSNPQSDLLFGYDLIKAESRQEERPNRKVHLDLVPFDPSSHVTGKEASEGSHGKDAKFRDRQKKDRTEQ